MTAGAFTERLTATDAAGGAQTATATITINPAPAGNYTVEDEGQGKITAVGADLMVGTRKLIWNAGTKITVNNRIRAHTLFWLQFATLGQEVCLRQSPGF
jgi:hypothetical protein